LQLQKLKKEYGQKETKSTGTHTQLRSTRTGCCLRGIKHSVERHNEGHNNDDVVGNSMLVGLADDKKQGIITNKSFRLWKLT
jgi:hypothetical protein